MSKKMETIEYRTIDKTKWDRGEWDNEPDKKQWLDKKTGYPCLIVRGVYHGALCGYVGVTAGHPYYGKDYDDVPVDAYCGLTFANKCQKDIDEKYGVCHKDPHNKDVWWFGFDCAHAYDYMPAMVGLQRELEIKYPFEKPFPSTIDSLFSIADYKNFSFVTKEVRRLARQLKALEKVEGG